MWVMCCFLGANGVRLRCAWGAVGVRFGFSGVYCGTGAGGCWGVLPVRWVGWLFGVLDMYRRNKIIVAGQQAPKAIAYILSAHRI